MNFNNRIQDCDRLKAELDKLRPLKNEELVQLRSFFRVGQTYSSNALEGNTLTEVETKVIIEDGLTVSGKPLREIYEATGNAKAFDYMMDISKNDLFGEHEILELHRIFFQQIDANEAGSYRKIRVFISGTDLKLPEPSKVPELMSSFVAELRVEKEELHPIELAAWIHNQLITIHPFVDGNGRTARLLMNLALIQAGYTVTIIPPIYRVQYLEFTRKGNDGIHKPFTDFLSCMLYESQKDLLRLLE